MNELHALKARAFDLIIHRDKMQAKIAEINQEISKLANQIQQQEADMGEPHVQPIPNALGIIPASPEGTPPPPEEDA